MMTCPSCVERVLPRSDGTCPACRACMDGPPPPGSRMALREGTAYPSICVTCGAPADDSTLVERGASRRSIPLALLGAFGMLMGLAGLFAIDAMPIRRGVVWMLFLIVVGLGLVVRGLARGPAVHLRVPHCARCHLPEVESFDPERGSLTMVVHDAFRRGGR